MKQKETREVSQTLETLVKKFKAGKIAPHVYSTDGASRDPECSIKGCTWYWSEHLEEKLLRIVKEAARTAAAPFPPTPPRRERNMIEQKEHIGKDGRSHFRVTGGNCACGWTVINEAEWIFHLTRERAIPKEPRIDQDAGEQDGLRPIPLRAPIPQSGGEPVVQINAFWREGVWQIEIDYHKKDSAFVVKDDLETALRAAAESAVENYIFRRDKAGEKLEGPERSCAAANQRSLEPDNEVKPQGAVQAGAQVEGALNPALAAERNQPPDLAERERVDEQGALRAGESFQQRVREWTIACFGQQIADDKVERNHRFLEESLELVQTLGCTQSEAHQLVDYVFYRPQGIPPQECGGVLVTLMALCNANGLTADLCGEIELERVYKKIEQIRAKQAAKPKHSPLSEPLAIPPAGKGDALSKGALDRLSQDITGDECEIEQLTKALEKIAALPLGHHDAKRIALDALEEASLARKAPEGGKGGEK
jgi:hypothetical protein